MQDIFVLALALVPFMTFGVIANVSLRRITVRSDKSPDSHARFLKREEL